MCMWGDLIAKLRTKSVEKTAFCKKNGDRGNRLAYVPSRPVVVIAVAYSGLKKGAKWHVMMGVTRRGAIKMDSLTAEKKSDASNGFLTGVADVSGIRRILC